MTQPQSDMPEVTAQKTITLTGYQYGDSGQFIGPYQFEKNKDKEEVHLPPRTTLTAPPSALAVDEEVWFDGEDWAVRKLNLFWLPDRETPADPPDEDVGDGKTCNDD